MKKSLCKSQLSQRVLNFKMDISDFVLLIAGFALWSGNCEDLLPFLCVVSVVCILYIVSRSVIVSRL